MYSPKKDSYAEVDRLAFAFKTRDGEINHIGFLYNGKKGEESSLLHLAFHHDLQRTETKNNYYWIDVDIADERKGALSGAVHKVWLKNQNSKIAYGIKYNHQQKHFKENGTYLGPSYGPGLTCATFIISVLHDNGYNLIDCKSWESRPDDDEFQKEISGYLRDNLSDLERLEAPQKDIEELKTHINLFEEVEECARYRPAEIAAAGGQSDIPVKFKDAIVLADRLIKAVKDMQ